MNFWFWAAVLTAILRAVKIEPLGIKGLSWFVIAFCLILAGITALFSLGILGQILLVPALIGMVFLLLMGGFLIHFFSR